MIHDFLFCSVGEQASIKPPQFIEWIYWICFIAVIWLHQMYRFTPPWGESGLGSISLKSTLSWFTPPGVNRDKQLIKCIYRLSVGISIASYESWFQKTGPGPRGPWDPSQKRAQKDENKVEIREKNKENREKNSCQGASCGQRHPCPGMCFISVIVELKQGSGPDKDPVWDIFHQSRENELWILEVFDSLSNSRQ